MDSSVVTTNLSPDITSGLVAFMATYSVFALLALVVAIVSLWRIFTKAGKPGWAALVPIYNIVVLLEVAGKPLWWIAFYLAAVIPGVGYLIVLLGSLLVSIDLAKKFGKSTTFGVVGLWLFSIIGLPMLAFGNAKYQGTTAAAPTATATASPATPEPPTDTPEA